jgi:hypothetical protein
MFCARPTVLARPSVRALGQRIPPGRPSRPRRAGQVSPGECHRPRDGTPRWGFARPGMGTVQHLWPGFVRAAVCPGFGVGFHHQHLEACLLQVRGRGKTAGQPGAYDDHVVFHAPRLGQPPRRCHTTRAQDLPARLLSGYEHPGQPSFRPVSRSWARSAIHHCPMCSVRVSPRPVICSILRIR